MKPVRFIYASRLERLVAFIIDRLLLMVPGAMFVAIWGTASGLPVALYFLVCLAYFTAFISGKWQASPGQRLMSMYVVHANGKPMTQRDSLERFLAFMLPLLPLYSSMISEENAMIISIWLVIFWFSPILYTPERVGMHDRICNTRVIVGRAEDRQ